MTHNNLRELQMNSR